MALSIEKYKELKANNGLFWDTNAIGKTGENVSSFLSGVQQQMTAQGAQWTQDEFGTQRMKIEDLRNQLRYMHTYADSIKDSDAAAYDGLMKNYNSLSSGLDEAENWFNKNQSGAKRTEFFEMAKKARSEAKQALGTAAAVDTLRKGHSTAAEQAEKYGLNANELESTYKGLRAEEKAQDRENRYKDMGAADLMGLLKSPDSLGKLIYDEVKSEYGNGLKNAVEFDKSSIYRTKAQKYGLTEDEVRTIVERMENHDDHHYDSYALSNEDRAYIAQRIIETGSLEELKELKQTLPSAKYYDSIRYRLKDAIEEKSEERYYTEIAERYPRVTQIMEQVAAIDKELPSLASTTGAPVGHKGQFNNIMDAQETRAAYMRELEAAGFDGEKMVKYYKRRAERLENEERQKAIKDWTSQNGFNAALASVASIPINMIGSVGDLPKIFFARMDELAGNDGWYDPKGTANYTAQNIRGTTTEMIDEAMKNAGVWNYLAKELYSAGMSGGDMVLAAAANAIPIVGQSASNMMFFSSAGVNAANEVVENGGDLAQATRALIASGGAELLFERISLDKLEKFAVSGNVTDANEYFKGILKRMFVEGSEEFNTTLANTFTDALINGGNNQIDRTIRQLEEQGYSVQDAKDAAWKQWAQGIINDAVGGALSGGVFGGIAGAQNAAAWNQVIDFGNQALTRGQVENLLSESNGEAVNEAKALIKDMGIDAVLKQAEKSEDAQTRRTAEHFAALEKDGKLDRDDAAQLLVKVIKERAATDAVARMAGVQTTGEHEATVGRIAQQLNGFDYAGNRLEKGMPEIKSSFGVQHPNGIAAELNGKSVTVVSIESSMPEYLKDDNTVSVKLSDGTVIDADGLTFNNPDFDRLMNLAKNYDTLGARALLSNYETAAQGGVSVDRYIQDFNRLYELGQSGGDFRHAAQNAYYTAAIEDMGEAAAQAAIAAGLNDGDISSATMAYFQRKVRVKGKAFSKSRVSVERDVKFDVDGDAGKVLQMIAEKTGKEIVLTNALNSDDKARYSSNTIFVNANQAEHAMVAAALHEAVHNLRAYSAGDFRTLQKFVTNYLTESGKNIQQELDSIAAVYGKDAPTPDVVMEELVCKSIEALAADKDALELALTTKKNRPIIKEVGEILKRIADRVMSYFKGDREKGELAHNRYAQAFLDDAKALRDMAEIVSRGFDNAQESEAKYGSKESEVRFARKGQTANSKINTYRGYRSYKNIDLNSLDDEEIKVYNRSGWAYDLLNDTDMLLLSQKIDEIHQELYAGKLRLKDGSYLVDVNDKALILTGTRQAPVINLVLLADTKSYKDNQDIVKDVIYESERFRHSEEEFTSFLKFAVSLYKEENLQLFKREDYQYKKTERDTGRRAEISSGFGNDRYSAEFQNRTGNGSKTQISESAIVNTEQGNNRYSKDDTIYDDPWDFLDNESEDGNKKVDTEKLLKRQTPDEAVYRLSERIGKRAVETIRSVKDAELTDEEYHAIARRIMKGYNIKIKDNEALENKIAQRVANFAEDIRRSPKSDYSVHMTGLYEACRGYLENSGKYERGFMKETAQKVKSLLRGRTLILPENAATYILGDYGDMQKLNSAYGGYITVAKEADKARVKNPVYMDELMNRLAEIQTVRELFADGKTPDDYTGWGFLDNLVGNVLQPKFVNPYYNNVYENMDDAAIEMANRIAVAVVDEMAGKAANSENADGQAARTLADSRNALVADNQALQKVKYEKYRNLKQVNQYYITLEKTDFRSQYIERQKKNAALRRLGGKLNNWTKRIDGKANKNEYIPEKLKKPLLDVLELFKADPGTYKNGKVKSEPTYFGAFRELTSVQSRVDALAREYAKLEGETDFKDALGFDVNAIAFDKGVLNELHQLSDFIEGKNVYQLNSSELNAILEVINDLDSKLKNAVKLIVDGKETTIQEQAAKGIEQMEKVYYKKDSKAFIKDALRDARNRFVATSLDPVRYGKFLSGYKEGAVWNLLMNDAHKGDQKRVRIMQQAYSAVQEVIAKYSRRELNDLQRKAVGDFTMQDIDTGEDVKLSQGLLLAIYLTNMQEDGHRHLCNERNNHYTRIADLDTLNGNRVLPDVRKKQQKAMGEYSHKVRFDETTLRRIGEYVESTPILKDLSVAMHDVFNGLLADEINLVSMQRYGKMIATVKNYFPLRVDSKDPNKQFNTSFEGENIFTDERMKSRGFTKQRTYSETAIVIGDALNVFQRHVNETAEYCGMLIPVENIKKVINSDNGKITMREEIEKKFGSSAIHYLDKLLSDIQKRKDNIDENLLTNLSGHAMGAALAFNPRSWLKNYGALPLANKHFGTANVAKAVAATKAGWGKTGKDLVEKYNSYTPYMWYREQGNGTIVGELSRQHGLYGKFTDAVDMMSKFDRAVVNLLLYASEQNVKQTTNIEVDSEEFKKEVAKRFEKCVDESQPNSMITSKPQFVRNNVMRVLSLNAFASQRMAMGNSLMDSFMEYRARSYENKIENTPETKSAAKKALKGFFSTFFGVLQSVGLQDLLGVLATVLIFHKWDDLKDEEGNVTPSSALFGVGKMWLKGFPEEFFGSFAWADRAYSFVEKRIDNNAYGSDFNVMSFSAIEDIAKNIESGNWAKAYGRFADLAGLPAFGGSNTQKLVQSGYSYINDLIQGRLGYTGNNGKVDLEYMDAWILNAVYSGDNKKAQGLINTWVQKHAQQYPDGGVEGAEKYVNGKLIEALADYEDVKQAAALRLEGKFKAADELTRELVKGAVTQEMLNSALTKAKNKILKEEAEGTEKADSADSTDSENTPPQKYQLKDAFAALKNGETESYEQVKGELAQWYVDAGQKENIEEAEKHIESQMRSANRTDPLFEELEAATDGSDKARLDRIWKQLDNVFGSRNAALEAYGKYKERKNK